MIRYQHYTMMVLFLSNELPFFRELYKFSIVTLQNFTVLVWTNILYAKRTFLIVYLCA